MNVTTRPLQVEEIVALVVKSRTPWKQIYFLSVYSGLRISDLMSLPWQPQPPSRAIREKKTRKLKFISWSQLACDHWGKLYEFGQPRKFLFPYQEPSTYRKHLQRSCILLGIDTYRIAFHSLRKSHAVINYRDGGLLAAKSAMNHSSVLVTERYIETALRFDNGKPFDRIFLNKEQPNE